MPRQKFTRDVANRVLIRCRRHCCVCGKLCGVKIEIHHIDGHDDNSEDNALPVCFDCHAEIGSYNEEHPRGRKYHPSELRKLREITFRKFSEASMIGAFRENLSDYGEGFRDGATLAQKQVDSQLVWNFVASEGDFGIEVLTMFRSDDSCSLTDETLYDEAAITGSHRSQYEGHQHAWDTGMSLGLWFADAGIERLFLTTRGRFFREVVRNTPDFRTRYDELEAFWRKTEWGTAREKPGAQPMDDRYAPGWLGWLQVEKYRPVKLQSERELFVLTSVEADEVQLQSVESRRKLCFQPEDLSSLEYDPESGVLTLGVADGALTGL